MRVNKVAKIKQKHRVNTNTKKDSVCSVKVEAVTFDKLWSSFPNGDPPPYIDKKTGLPPKGFSNQCSIRASTAIHGAGVEMKSFKGVTVSVDGNRLAIRAEELANWLKSQPFCGLPQKPEDISGEEWDTKIQGRTGIIFFKDYWKRPGEKTPSGDHIDLWNGSRLTSRLTSFIELTLGIRESTFLELSNFGKGSQILFWEVK
jgi:hypothetical protein